MWFDHLRQLPCAKDEQTAWWPGSGWESPAVPSQSAFLHKCLSRYCLNDWLSDPDGEFYVAEA